MIRYEVKHQDDVYSIEVKGHANYANYGNDIVCASVSTAVILTANLLERLDLSYNIHKLVCEDGNFLLVVKDNNELTNKIMVNLEETLRDLENQYPNYIKIKK